MTSADPAFALLGPIEAWSLPCVARRQAAHYGERPFIRFGAGPELSFAGLHEGSDRVATALSALGVARGDRVLAMLGNRAEFLLLALGCGRIGAVFVPVNTELKGYSLQHQLQNCAPKVVVLQASLAAAFASVDPPVHVPAALVTIAAEEGAPPPAIFAGARLFSFERFLAQAKGHACSLADPQPAEIACIMYTSGTTGPAKGVLMSHAHLALFSVPSASLALGEGDTYYVCMPLFHANALFIQVFAALLCGARVHCVERFSPQRWLAEVRACGATVTNSLGMMTEMLFKSPEQPDDHLNPLRAVLAVPVANEWIARFCERFGVRVFQGFGMTECNMIAYATPDDPLVSGCCGTVRGELFEVAIFDPESDQPMADGEVGEIVVRPRLANAFMQGYHAMPEKTVEAWRNLWFHTGDAGRLEAGTRLHFVDRIKDRIRRRGENVSAYEVEQVLSAMPGVAECAIVGIRVGDAGAEQEIKAAIVLAPGAALSPVEVLNHCLARVPRFAVPRYIEFLDALPKTASGKLQKHLLRESGVGPATWDRERAGHGARSVLAQANPAMAAR
jgi:carnitine-CoA ligase